MIMNRDRLYALDFLKVIATVLIVFHHYQSNTGAVFNGINFYYGRFYFGYLVEFFFVLSGFFSNKWIERVQNGLSFREFYIHRAVRLLPIVTISTIVFEVADLVFAKVAGTHYPSVTTTLWGTIITSLGMQAGWMFNNPQINGAVWYISVLLLCYAIFFAIVYFSKFLQMDNVKKAASWGFVFMICLGIGIQTYQIELPFMNNYSARGFYSFFFGVLFAEFLKNIRIDKRIICLSVASIAIITAMIVVVTAWVEEGTAYIMTFIYFPAVIVLFSSERIQKILHKKWIGTLSEISFDVYIWHSVFLVVMHIVMIKFNLSINHSYLTMTMFAVLMYIVGTISYYCIEKPINKALKKYINA